MTGSPGTCSAAMRFDRLRLYGALGAIDYRERLLHEAPLLPVER